MPEPTSPKKPQDSSTSKILRNAPVDLLAGIITTSILSSNPFSETSHQKTSTPRDGMREKPPLSVPVTSLNFKNFVSKSGPLFAAQDAVEAVICWQNPSKTLACACLWAWLSLYPFYFILLPNFGLIWILLTTHSLKFTHGMGDDLSVNSPTDSHHSDDPIEGSPDYLSNLNLMGDVTYGIDLIKDKVLVYLNWSNPKHSLRILQVNVLATIVLGLVGPFIPWRIVLLISGEAMFLLNHPSVQLWIKHIKPSSNSV